MAVNMMRKSETDEVLRDYLTNLDEAWNSATWTRSYLDVNLRRLRGEDEVRSLIHDARIKADRLVTAIERAYDALEEVLVDVDDD